MGKLYKIRREFDKLDHETKLSMYRYKHGYRHLYYRGWHFAQRHSSYHKFVAKLANAYYNKHVIPNRHVLENAYLNKEPWAIDKMNAILTGDSS